MKLIFYVLILFIPSANAYFSHTHRLLGSLGKQWLEQNDPILLKSLESYIGYDFEYASEWADKIKSQPKYFWTKSLHYVDLPTDKCGTTLTHELLMEYCHPNCLYTALTNQSDQLSQAEYFKFLLHFIQDLHQPLHVLGIKRGGNDWPITFYFDRHNFVHTNMHTLWDSLLPEYYIKHDFTKNKQVVLNTTLDTDTDITNYIIHKIQMVWSIACNVTLNIDDKIYLDSYYNQNTMTLLFKSYMETFVTLFSRHLKQTTNSIRDEL